MNSVVCKSMCVCHHKQDAGCSWWTDHQKGRRILPMWSERKHPFPPIGNASTVEMMQRVSGHVLASRGSIFRLQTRVCVQCAGMLCRNVWAQSLSVCHIEHTMLRSLGKTCQEVLMPISGSFHGWCQKSKKQVCFFLFL